MKKTTTPKKLDSKKLAPAKLAPKAATKTLAKPVAMKSAPAKLKKEEPKVKLALNASAGLKKLAAPKTAPAKAGKADLKAAKVGAKIDKKSAKLEEKTELSAAPANEDEEDDLEMGSSSGSAQAGLAAATASANADATAGSLKNFRHHPDIENYYRFIYENDLRYEALEIIDVIVSQRANRKQVKAAKGKSH